MTRRNWKRIKPNSQEEAIRLCIEHASEKRNLSVAGVGDHTGVSEWVVYKWMADGSIPSKRIRPFENACGCTFVTQYLATSAHKLIIDIPSGRPAKDTDLLALQTNFNEAVNLLAKFYKDSSAPAVTIQSLTQILSQIASHRENISSCFEPELLLFEKGDSDD